MLATLWLNWCGGIAACLSLTGTQGCRVRGSLAERFALGGTCVQGICRENALVALAEMPLERLPEFLLGRLESVADRPLHAEEALPQT